MATDESGKMHEAEGPDPSAERAHGASPTTSHEGAELTLSMVAARLGQLELELAALRREMAPETMQAAAARERGAEAREEGDRGALRAIAPPPPPPPPASSFPAFPSPRPPKAAPGPRLSLEDRLGSQIFNMVGIVALIVGTSWGLKLAFEHGLIGPAGRVLIGLAAGIGLVVWSERFRRKGMRAFSYSLKAVGCGVLYLSLWAAFQLYHLLPSGVALIAMMLVTAWIAFMAWTQDAELLAAYALAGGLATPLLLSSGGDHETFLFAYVAAIDAAAILLVRYKPWPRLLVPAFLATVAYFAGWYSSFFSHEAQSGLGAQAWETVAFALLFFALFAVVSMKGWTRYAESETKRRDVLVPVLIPLMNATFVGVALYTIFRDRDFAGSLPWVMLGLSALFLGLMRVQRTALASAVHLAAAVVFLTVAIPLKAHGHTLTVAWLVEGLVLFWVSTRFERTTAEAASTAAPNEAEGNRAPVRLLQRLSLAGYLLGLGSLVVHWFWYEDGFHRNFFNHDLFAALVAVTVLAAAGGLSLSRLPQGGLRRIGQVPLASLLGINLVGVLLASGELFSFFWRGFSPVAFRHAGFWTALVGLAVLAGAAWASHRLTRESLMEASVFARLAGATLVLFNLLAVLTFVYEIGGLWGGDGGDARLERSLAVSGFLMLYGAGLLAIGFWRRNPAVRWQALLLLIFTIAKVFLYDIGGLSAGYRVASFMGLGALLMGVSFAYQKDWLGLKRPPATPVPIPLAQEGE